jgi:hypothetical protein
MVSATARRLAWSALGWSRDQGWHQAVALVARDQVEVEVEARLPGRGSGGLDVPQVLGEVLLKHPVSGLLIGLMLELFWPKPSS